jgi:hypothetical protein
MREADWLTSTDPDAMFEVLRDRAADRQLRLFTVACCRRAGDELGERGRRALALAERCAEGEAPDEQMAALEEELRAPGVLFEDPKVRAIAALVSPEGTLLDGGADVVVLAVRALAGSPDASQYSRERAAQAELLREVFGNPFRPPPSFDPRWRAWDEARVVKMAEGIYEEGAFERMPILADALLDAGCEDELLLAHCSMPGEHVRGCWLLDLLLEKARPAPSPTERDLAELARLGLWLGVLDPECVPGAPDEVPGASTPGLPVRLLLARVRRLWRGGRLGVEEVWDLGRELCIEDLLPSPACFGDWWPHLQVEYEEFGDGLRTEEEMRASIGRKLAPYAAYEALLPSWAG